MSAEHAHIKTKFKMPSSIKGCGHVSLIESAMIEVTLVENCDIMDLCVTKWNGFMC